MPRFFHWRITVSTAPKQFENVTAVCKANIYFDGKVVSHTLLLPGGKKTTLGLIFPGAFKFNTDAPERMDIVAGTCHVKLAGDAEWKTYGAGTFFKVPGKSHFEIAVDQGVAEYICTFE
jgi:purine/pyrimidine-nucleoside phosphorylase